MRLSDRCKVQMLLIGPLSDARDFGVIDLDLVVNLVGGGDRPVRDQEDCRGAGGSKPDATEAPPETPTHSCMLLDFREI